MPTVLSQEFCLHPVGQGLFYSGGVTVNLPYEQAHFNFVMDCGSLNKNVIREEVNLYRQNLDIKEDLIDLLIISHFDADHVNNIGHLLKDKKVKKIVAPFLHFTERVIFGLRAIEQGIIDLNDPDDAFTLSLIIDPVGTLTDYLDDDGEFILIDHDPDKPTFPPPEEDNVPEKRQERSEGNNRLSFTITPLSPLTPGQINAFRASNFSKVQVAKDSSKGHVSRWQVNVMEFLFYKKHIGKGESAFFEKVYQLFIEVFKSHFKEPSSPTMWEIIEAIKGIASATIIKELFSQAFKEAKNIDLPEGEVKNMNTTALCLLHYNLPNFLRYIENRISDHRFYPSLIPISIQQFDGTHQTRIAYRTQPKNLLILDYNMVYNRAPNSLLTSDSFLLKPPDVESFYRKYQNYWDKYWLFQVPHHGSRHNADATLLSTLPSYISLFINYGVKKEWGGTWRHPSPDLINDLVATGNSTSIFPINEFNGLQSHFKLNYYQ